MGRFFIKFFLSEDDFFDFEAFSFVTYNKNSFEAAQHPFEMDIMAHSYIITILNDLDH